MKIIYRVYEKGPGGSGFWGNYDNILNQDVCICNSRDHFKDIMRSMYGEDIKFANSKKLVEGTPYIVIISEDCYDAEAYVSVMDYTCSCCGKQFKAIPKSLKKVGSTWEFDRLCHELLLKRKDEIDDMVFCSEGCKGRTVERLKEEFNQYNEDHDLLPDFYIDKNSFAGSTAGYIYKITKRSTGEFYVGQTKSVPIFRWGQHLTTPRFDIKNIDDYIFEVIEIVPYTCRDELLAREAYWITKEREKAPDKSLNNQLPDTEKWEEKVNSLK